MNIRAKYKIDEDTYASFDTEVTITEHEYSNSANGQSTAIRDLTRHFDSSGNLVGIKPVHFSLGKKEQILKLTGFVFGATNIQNILNILPDMLIEIDNNPLDLWELSTSEISLEEGDKIDMRRIQLELIKQNYMEYRK